jgi:hypothetical protein
MIHRTQGTHDYHNTTDMACSIYDVCMCKTNDESNINRIEVNIRWFLYIYIIDRTSHIGSVMVIVCTLSAVDHRFDPWWSTKDLTIGITSS